MQLGEPRASTRKGRELVAARGRSLGERAQLGVFIVAYLVGDSAKNRSPDSVATGIGTEALNSSPDAAASEGL